MRLLLAVGLLLLAGSADAAAPRPPYSLLGELNALCVKTKVEPKAMAGAAKARGYRQIEANQFGLGAWDQTINLVIQESSVQEYPGLGLIQAHACLLLVRPGSERDVDDIFNWLDLGRPPLKQHYSFTVSDHPVGGRQVLNGNTPAQLKSLYDGTLRLVLLERLPGATRIRYMKPRSMEER